MSKRKHRKDDVFLDPQREKRELWKGIAALIGLILLFFFIVFASMNGMI